MFSEGTKEKINLAIIAETNNACDKWSDQYNSLHEGYAVLKEEVDEARDNQIVIRNNMFDMWGAIKCDNTQIVKGNVERIRKHAELMALEAVQVAAVCNKILNGL